MVQRSHQVLQPGSYWDSSVAFSLVTGSGGKPGFYVINYSLEKVSF